MTFIKKNAGLLRSVRSWAARGLMLALLVSLSTLSGVSSFTGGATSLAQGPLPQVTLNVPPEVLIGEKFKFNVEFKNATGADTGFGPYLEVYLRARGIDSNSLAQKCDGVSFVDARALFINPPNVLLTPPFYDSGLDIPPNDQCPKAINNPLASVNGWTAPVPPTPITGYQLALLLLPFGSFDASQPPIRVEVDALMSDFADVGMDLDICVRGGFRYGVNALDDPATDPLVQSTLQCAKTKPTVLKIKKEYLGPEDEAVAGPNFVNYYPLKYKITVDIADGQKIHNLQITDNLPGGLQYHFEKSPSNLAAIQVLIYFFGLQGGLLYPAQILSTCKNPPPTAPPGYPQVTVSVPTSGPNGTIVVTSCGPIAGQPGISNEVVIEFEFYIPNNVLDADCDPSPVLVKNDIKATGDWDPLDPRDPNPTTVTSDMTTDDHILNGKCLAIQKYVLVPPGGPKPGDVLEYTLRFQISDYHTIGKIQITDLLSDGQRLVNSPALPRLIVGDQFPNSSYTVSLVPHMSEIADPNILCPGPTIIKGGTKLSFDVSGALAAAAAVLPTENPRHLAGILTGGFATVPTPIYPPATTPAIGEIVFYAKIQDKFAYQHSGTDKEFVDKHDPLTNCVKIGGTIYDNKPAATIPGPTSVTVEDTSATQVTIVTDFLKKSVYRVRRGTTIVCGPPSLMPCDNLPGPPQEVRPGDEVTFRIEYSIPSGDAESLYIQDWLPLPVFDVGDPNGDLTPGPPWNTGLIPTCITPPGPGNACRFIPTDTLGPPFLIGFPILAPPSVPTNSLRFEYTTLPAGAFNDPLNQPKKIDLLFTLTVTNKPFADGLFLTNEAQECEKNTFGVTFCQVAVAQVKVREPKLGIKKGVVATNNPHGVFTPPVPPSGPGSFTPPPGAACPRFTPTINSANLPGLINSDLSNVDAGDWVTFAIAIENTGGAPAYNIELADIIPLTGGPPIADVPSCFEPNFGGLCVRRGDGTPISFTTAPGGHGRIIIKLDPFFALDPYHATNGRNIVIITFEAQLLDKDKLKAGCCENKAELIKYGSSPQQEVELPPPAPPPPTVPNFVAAGFGGPFVDTAKVCVGPRAFAKCIQATSELHTTPQQAAQGGTVNAAIGEIVRFRLDTVIPEGTTLNFQITDLLPMGLTYVGNPKAIFVANNPVTNPNPPDIGTVKPPTLPDDPLSCPGGPTPTSSITVSPAIPLFGAGTDPSFPAIPINITNNDNDPDLEFLIIEFNAQVDNILGNQASTNLPDRFVVRYQDAHTNQTVTSPPSGPVTVHIVEPNLTLTKTANPTSVVQGGTVTYTVTITNTGTATAFDVVFTDTLPAGLTLVPPAFPVPSGCTNGSTLPGNVNVTCNSPSFTGLPVNGVLTIMYQATVSPTVLCNTTLTNKATVTWTSLPGPQGTLPSLGNPTGQQTVGPSGAINGERNGSDGLLNSGVLNDYQVQASATVTVKCPCDLAIKKTVTPAPPLLLVTITLTVPAGQTCAPGTVVVGDQQPTGMTFINLPTSLVAPASGWNCSATTPNSLSCTNTTTLAGLYTATFTFPATVQQPGVVNCATATVSGQLISQSCVTIPVAPPPDLTLRKTREGNLVSGQPGRYILTVINVGPAPTTKPISVIDPVPVGLTPVSATGTGWICIVLGQLVTCTNPGPFAPNQSSTITLNVRVTAPPRTEITNCGTVSTEGDANKENDRGCDTATVQGETPRPPDLTLRKTLDGQLRTNQNATYRLTITNLGQGATTGPITVTDTLPSGLTFVSAIGPGWSCAAVGQTVTCTSPGPLAPNASSTIALIVRVTARPGTQITNCAVVSTPGDVNAANNQGCHTATVQGAS